MWYLIEKNEEYYAEKKCILPYSHIKQRVIFRDINRKILSLGKNKEFALFWIKTKNEIDSIL